MFRFLVPTWNCEPWIVSCLVSLCTQDRDDWTCCVVDDASTDQTGKLCDQVAAADSRIEVIHRSKRCGALANLQLAAVAQMPADEDVLVTVDGDDRLLHRKVLTRLAEEYTTGAQITYGDFVGSAGEGSWVETYPKDVRDARTYRIWRWQATHLRTFTYRLFRSIRRQDLLDTETGRPWEMAWDCALMLPMLEMCRADQVRCIKDKLYWYNFGNPQSDHRKNAGLQKRSADTIMAMPKYEMLPW